jgi:hypothetical protein
VERRHLTILFYDLVRLITITARFDPEEWRATVVPTKKVHLNRRFGSRENC